ncbi:MAG: alpha/beta hydrolase [Oscillospiraceae bacterium]|nr:alpha/beta hydrolase [Oscillospiraceae bacterium]
MKKIKKKTMIAIIILAVLIALIMIILPPSSGILPKCTTPNGISEKTFLTVDGAELGLILLSDDTAAPVLLVCGGGPGIPQYLMEDLYPSPLPHKFTVCYWDYRGTGISWSPDITSDEMNTDRYINDAIAVTDYLAQRFGKDKIYIMGHSFGTYIALNTVQRYPERYTCYIAMSQICDQKQSEYTAFDYMRQQYADSGDTKMTAEFDSYDIRGSAEDYERYKYSGLRDKAMHGLGVGTTRDMRSVISDLFLPSLRCMAYTQSERINIWKSKFTVSKNCPAGKDSNVFNAYEDVQKLDIPIYFIVGKYDCTCMASLQETYYEAVEAPVKKLYIFENSAHSPLYEEYDRSCQVLDEIIAENSQM